ncbi:MAG: heme o synthase [Halanaeroarchaeum sp.]
MTESTIGRNRLANALDRHRTGLLVGSAMGVYVLVLLGATTSILSGAPACPTWPTCNGSLVSLGSPAVALAWGHRVLGILVGVLIATTWVAIHRHGSRRQRRTLTAAAVLYPVQAAMGAYIAVRGPTQMLAATHLTVAMVIFTGHLVTLLWHLESEHGRPDPADGREPRSLENPSTDGDAVTPDRPRRDRVGPLDRARAYVRMTKPRLMWLLALVAMAAMGLAAGPALEGGTIVATIAGGVLAIGASGTFNHVLERDRDRRMSRTADRPVATDAIPPRRALAFGAALGVLSTAVFLVFVNPLAAALGVLAILFYTVVYTVVLKPHTEHNTVLGGAVGAFPALIGWAAVTEGMGMPAVALGLVVFLWTPAHFYNLALAYETDYARAGYPMLPVVAGEATTRRHILGYLGGTLAAAVLLGTATELGWLYALANAVLGAVFVVAVVHQFRERTESAAFRSFHASNAYLGIVLLAIVFDTLLVA